NQDRLQLVKALLAKGAEPNARITTSTMMMSYVGYPTKGAFEPFACGTGDLRGATPLWVAALNANSGSSLSFQGSEGNRDADMSGATATTEILKALLAAKADLNATTIDGTTPLMAAAGLG